MSRGKIIKVLVSNDDGILAPGVTSLVHELIRHRHFNVRVCCPDVQQSAMSHSISIHHPLWCEPYDFPDTNGVHVPALRVHGTPADCVKLALSSACWEDCPDYRPDLVISGINAGSNTGLNVMYSGTCGAAMEANVNGIPSIALSLDYPEKGGVWHYAQSAELALKVIERVCENGFSLPADGDGSESIDFKSICVNVNFPNLGAEKIKGWKVVSQGTSQFRDWFVEQKRTEDEVREHPTRRVFRIDGEMEVSDPDDTLDSFALKAGYVTVTPLSLLFQSRLSLSAAKAMETDRWNEFPCE